MAHLWELGGGTFLSKLIDVPISVETLRYAYWWWQGRHVNFFLTELYILSGGRLFPERDLPHTFLL